MWGVVSKVEKERLFFIGRLFFRVINGPASENFRGVAGGFYFLLVAAHPVDAAPQVLPVIIHHVRKESVEKIETAVIWNVRRFKTQMPFANHAGVVARLAK